MTKPTTMVSCPECKGAGGTFEDCADSRGEHTTRGSACETCLGTGEVEARCDCGGPADHVVAEAPTGVACTACKAYADEMELLYPVGQANVETARAEVRAMLPGLFS